VAIRYEEIKKWCIIDVEFGTPKSELAKDSFERDRRANEDFGINLGNEFSYYHKAVVLSYQKNGHTLVVIPITTYLEEHEHDDACVIIEKHFGLDWKSVIKVDAIRQIDKKRARKLISHNLSKTLQNKTVKVIESLFCI
jgi:mRNA-degrading endonuclease toxin of MazEF toxin-antitoxin module